MSLDRKKFFKNLILSIFLIGFSIWIDYYYVNLHERVHVKNCVYHHGNATRINFFTVKCNINTKDISNLNTLNEIVLSIVVPMLYMFTILGIVFIWK